MEYGAFFGNMTDDQRNAWAKLSTDEREEIKRALEQEEKMKKDAEDAKSVAKAKAAQASARNYSGDQFRFFPELRGDSADTESDPLLLTDYRGQRGTPESLSNIPPLDGDAGLSETAVSRRGPLDMGDYVADSVKSGAVGDTLRDLGLTKDLGQTAKEMAHKDRVIDKDEILEHQGTDLAIKLQKEEEAARIAAEVEKRNRGFSPIPHIRNAQIVEAARRKVKRPSQLAPLPESVLSEKNHPLLVAQDRKIAADAAEEDIFGASREGEFLDAQKDIEKAKTIAKIDAGMAFMKPEGGEKDGEGDGGIMNVPGSRTFAELEEQADKELAEEKKGEKKGEKKEVEKIQETVKQAVLSGKPPKETDDFVGYDDRGYPKYRRGSKWAKSFNEAFGRSLEQEGNKTFSWTGHDGKSRSYNNKRAVKTIKDAKVTDPKKPIGPVPPKAEKVERSSEFISAYIAAPEKEKPKLLETEVEKATTDKDKKEIIGTTKEQDKRGPDRYFVDPFTGWAMCLTCAERRKDRKQIMELAATLPAASRAAYYFSKGLIKKEDFDLVTKDQNLKDAMARQLTQLKIDEAGWKIISAKAEAEKDPKRKEYLKMFIAASSAKNYELLSHLGGLLDLDEGIMKTMKKAQLDYEMAKLESKANKGGLKTAFSGLFGVDYSTVISNKLKWIDKATAIIQTEGIMQEYNLDGKIVRDRSGRFRTYGLKEQSDMKALPYAEQKKIVARSPYFKFISGNTAFHNSKGEFDVSLLVKNKDAYEKYLKNDLVYLAMNDAYSEQYEQMMAWVEKNSYNYQREQAKLEKLLTANAALTEKGDKINPTSELKL